jgi:hypothetical protein
MKPTTEQIDLMDKIFDKYMERHVYHKNMNPNIINLSKWFSTDEKTIQYFHNEVCRIGKERDLLQSQKGILSYSLVHMFPIPCETFKNSGGFKTYFNDIDNEFKVVNNITNIDQSIKVENQSSLSMADNKPAIDSITNTIKQTPPKKSWLEITSWIVAIIIGLIGVYEFIIKK